ncbi:MAG: hypothetical protein ABI680_08540, partial [Chthoniobacteraceae bacterium]
MRRAAAILCLIYAVVCGVFWVRSFSRHELISIDIVRRPLIISSGYGMHDVGIFSWMPESGSGLISFGTASSEPISAADWGEQYGSSVLGHE